MGAAETPRGRPRTVGIALGAGGARGLAHVGVLKTLSAAGIPIDAVVGTSIGAVVGAMYAAGRLEQFEKQVRAIEWSDVLRMFDPVWPRSGLMSGIRAVDWLTSLVGDWKIEDLAIPFGAVTVDLVTGDELLIREGRVVDAIRASMSIPGVFVPHRSGKRLLVDGALRNPVPVSELEPLGVEVRLAVNLHAVPVREIRSLKRAAGPGVKRPIATRVSDAIESRLARFRRNGRRQRKKEPDAEARGGPNLFEILTASMSVLEHELALHRLAREPVDVVMAPDVHAVRAFEFHKARQAIHAGHVEAEAKLDEIREVLARRRRRRYWSRGSNS
jgi:NTE family protein